jgi:CMP-N-acetylneuraminic acid synthetase
MFEIDPIEACDIDEELDFHIAELLYKERENK